MKFLQKHWFLYIWLLQVTDYAIARRIVDLHARQSESVERFYSVEDIQRYLTFARQFQPQVGFLLQNFNLMFIIHACQ